MTGEELQVFLVQEGCTPDEAAAIQYCLQKISRVIALEVSTYPSWRIRRNWGAMDDYSVEKVP